MKKIIPFYLYPFYFKYIGLSIGLAGLFLSIILDPGYQLLLYFGLILIVFAKEKAESDLVVKIRAESFKTVLGYSLALITVLFLMEVIYSDFSFPCSPALLLGVPLILYVAYFNLLLIINRSGTDDGHTAIWTGPLPWIAFAVIISIVLVVIFSG